MNRREFLGTGALASLAFLFPGLLARLLAAEEKGAGGSFRWDRVLVLVELQGGNDGLNTLVPFTDPRYYALRPALAVEKDRVLALRGDLGFNPALKALLPSWQDKDLALALGVGYEKPNRSHFRSIEIWETGSDSEAFLQEGWLARALSPLAAERLAAHGIVLGRGNEGPLAGPGIRTLVMQEPGHFLEMAGRMGKAPPREGNRALAHLVTVQNDLKEAAGTLKARLAQAPPLKAEFPRNPLGLQLETAAKLLAAGTPVPVLKVTLGGFDTHQNQRGQHDRLLTELAGSLAAFREACQGAGLWDRVLVMTYSEFGRRVAGNGSGGTDHGTAAPHLLMGGKVKGGFHGSQPSLAGKDLDQGDLRFTMDYRRLYATATEGWWGLPADPAHPPLDCLVS